MQYPTSKDARPEILTPLLTDEQVHQRYGPKPKTLANWRYEGKGPRFVKFGHLIRYRPEDLEEYLDGRVFKSTSEYSVFQNTLRK